MSCSGRFLTQKDSATGGIGEILSTVAVGFGRRRGHSLLDIVGVANGVA